MKRLIVSSAVCLLLIALFMFSTSRLPEPTKTISPPPERIDIAKAALIVAKEVFPNIDIDSYLSELDQMADEISLIMIKGGGNPRDPEYRIRAINTYFFSVQKYSYDNADFFGRQPTNCFLNGIMDTRKGACFTMPLLYLCLAQRLGFPIYGVNVPQHFFLRYDDGKYRSNIEVTCGGAMATDQVYIEDFQILTRELEAGVFMRNLSDLEVVSNIIEARGNYYLRIKDYQKAVRDLEQAVMLNPTNSEVFYNLAKIYRRQPQTMAKAERCLTICKELGYNFNRKENERDTTYIEYFIKICRQNGIDTAELEALRNKEPVRQKESDNQQYQMVRQTPEPQYQELIKANAINRAMMQQRALPPNPMPPQPPNPEDNKNRWR